MTLHIINSQKRSFYNELIIRTYVASIDITAEEIAALKAITECDYIATGYSASLDSTSFRGDSIWANADERVADEYGKFIIEKDEEVIMSESEEEIDVLNATEDTLDERIWDLVHADYENACDKKYQIRF